MRDVLQFELTSLPFSLATVSGGLTKTVKSNLFQKLETRIPTLLQKPTNCYIFDGMVLLQKLPAYLETFGAVSDYVLKKRTNMTHNGPI